MAPDGSGFVYATGVQGYLCGAGTASCEAITGGLVDQVAWRAHTGHAVMKLVAISATGTSGVLVEQPEDRQPTTLHLAASVVRFVVR
jgi:hypothetical protein